MEVGKVQARGQITLPHSIRTAARIKAGDLIGFEVTATGRVEIHVVSRMTMTEAFARFQIEGTIDEPRDREAWQDDAARDVQRD